MVNSLMLSFDMLPTYVHRYTSMYNSPCSSMNFRAFSKNDGVPSTSSKASKIGRPMTVDLGGSLSFTIKKEQKNYIKERKKLDFYSIKNKHHHIKFTTKVLWQI